MTNSMQREQSRYATNQQYRPEIDGLRAIAVASVVLFHAGFPLFRGGFVGVDVFFVISGFLIGSILVRELSEQTYSVSQFYERRARRILPALYVIVSASCIAAFLLLLPSDAKQFSQSMVSVVLFASNFFYWWKTDYFAASAEEAPLLHTWSLAVEEQFYLFFPLLLAALWRRGPQIALWSLSAILLASLSVSVWSSSAHPTAAFYLLPARAWELLLGAVVALAPLSSWERSGRDTYRVPVEVVAIASVVVSIMLFDSTHPYPGWRALPPVVGTAILLRWLDASSPLGRALSARPVVSVGLMSYSLYLWHQPVFALYRYRSLGAVSLEAKVGLVGATALLSYLSWRLVEVPSRRIRIDNTKTLIAYVAPTACLLAVGIFGHFSQGLRFRYNETMLDKVNGTISQITWLDGCIEALESAGDHVSGCATGTSHGRNRLALIGDSHAIALSKTLADTAQAHGFELVSFAVPSCLPVRAGRPSRVTTYSDVCARVRASFFDQLALDTSFRTVVIAARWPRYLNAVPMDNQEGGVDEEEQWSWTNREGPSNSNYSVSTDIRESVISIVESGHNVLLLYATPEMGWNVPRGLLLRGGLSGRIGASDFSISSAVAAMRMRRSDDVLDSVPHSARVARLRPFDVLCNTFLPHRCVAHLAGVPLYTDNNHLSGLGAALISSKVIAVIDTMPQF